jgi:hypothetical protein
MTPAITPRPISAAEVAVIRAALVQVPSRSPAGALKKPLEDLEVVGRCDCGCDSVDFVPSVSDLHSRPIADGMGTTPTGGTVGVIVWGTDDAVTSLEVYDLGAGDAGIRLPVPDTIRSW